MTPLAFALLLFCFQDADETAASMPASAPRTGGPADGRIQVARLAYERKDYPRAERELRAGLLLEPDRPELHLRLGIVLFRLRRYGDAIPEVERAVAANSTYLADSQIVGHCYAALGKMEEAVAWYRRVLEAKPTNREALRGLGNALEKLDRLDEAEEALRRSVAASPDYAPPLLSLGRVLVRRKQAAIAIPYLERARQLDPFEPDVEYELKRAYRDTGAEEKAEEASQRHRFLSEHRSGIDSMRNRLLANPGDLSALVGLAHHYDVIGDAVNAKATWERAYGLGRADGRLRAARAYSYVAIHEHAAAETLLLEWVKANPLDVPGWEALWFVRKQRGNAAGAEAAADKVRKLAAREPVDPPPLTTPTSAPSSAPAADSQPASQPAR